MHHTDLDHQLAAGAAVRTVEDVELLVEASVTAVVCLQSDADVASYHFDTVRDRCVALGMTHTRVPIIDFEPEDLWVHLDAAVAAVQAQVEGGRKVYVHCTVGLNRSPSVVIAWLVAHRGRALRDATEWLMERREVYPYPDVMQGWAERHGFPL